VNRAPYLRIGEVSDRTGIAPALLRAWERRYGLLRPARSAGGFRLYGDDDVDRVRRTQHLIAGGIAAAEAARLVLADADAAAEPRSPLSPAPLLEALVRLDDVGANAVLDRLLAAFSVETVMTEALVPALHEIGERWERGDITVGQEHFASTILRGRLLALARGWDQGGGASIVLACPPGERHDLPLVMLGLALRSRGWRITFLGADTPLESVDDAAERTGADAVALVVLTPGILDGQTAGLGRLAQRRPLVLGGPAASPALATRVGARHLTGDPVTAADALADLVAGGR
jgi:DNA-binding transcriptional MerR regulator